MRRMKMLGLAAVAAMAVVALAGAASTSATTLCKVTFKACGGSVWPAGTEIHSVLKANEKWEVRTDPDPPEESFAAATCEESTLQMKTTKVGGAGETVVGTIEKGQLTFGKCSVPVETVKGGTFEVHYTGKGAGSITLKGIEITAKIFTEDCIYGAGEELNLGTLTEPASPTTDTFIYVNATIKRVGGSSFLCRSSMRLATEYTVTSPSPLYVAES